MRITFQDEQIISMKCIILCNISKKKTNFHFIFTARAKKLVSNSSNQATPQPTPEYRSTVRRNSGVTQSQRMFFFFLSKYVLKNIHFLLKFMKFI